MVLFSALVLHAAEEFIMASSSLLFSSPLRHDILRNDFKCIVSHSLILSFCMT